MVKITYDRPPSFNRDKIKKRVYTYLGGKGKSWVKHVIIS